MAITQKIKSFFVQCRRVWHILKKPDSKEFKIIAKISAISILLIGLLGFVIALIVNLI